MSGLSVSRMAGLAVVLLGLVTSTFAQEDEGANTTGYNAIIDNFDLLIDNYSRFLGRKYDLTEEQNEYTKYLLRERSYEFLEQHEGNLRKLVDRLFDVRTGGEMTTEELIQWGQQAQPIYEEAKKLIIAGNEEWREILTPEQQQIHDEDVQLMTESFKTTEEQLNRILTGDMTVEEFRSPQRGRRSSRARSTKTTPTTNAPAIDDSPPTQPPKQPQKPPRLRKPPSGNAEQNAEDDGSRSGRPNGERKSSRLQRGSNRSEPGAATSESSSAGRKSTPTGQPADKATEQKAPETAWEKYVREFIAKYQLNDEQAQKANAVLKDCEDQAKRIAIGNQDKIEKIDQQLAEVKQSQDKKKSKTISALTEQRKKLTAPIDQIFEQQLKPRLERLPTRAQLRAAEEATKKKSSPKQDMKAPAKTPSKPADKKDD